MCCVCDVWADLNLELLLCVDYLSNCFINESFVYP